MIDLSTEEARKAGISHTETSRNLGRRTSFHMNELLSLKIPEDNLCMAKVRFCSSRMTVAVVVENF